MELSVIQYNQYISLNSNKINEPSETKTELQANQVLTSKELRELRYKRVDSDFGKNKKKAGKFNYWDLSGGLFGI